MGNHTSLPAALQSALEKEANFLNIRQVSAAREELTRRYQNPSGRRCMITEADRQAYLFCRLPATFGALSISLRSATDRLDLQPQTLLDLGAGPGTAMWAACNLFPSLQSITLLERDQSLIALGKRLAEHSDDLPIRTAQWIEEDLEKVQELPPHDLVILSYSIGELRPEAILPLLDASWKAAGKLLLVLEPGTPAGFERIRMIRSQLVQWGGFIAAPCPHHLECPMAGTDWCHFAARVERSSLHRQLKGGTMGYEDEKFSYIAAAKQRIPTPSSRILSEPDRHSGHVVLKLCTKEQGLQQHTVSKKEGALYKVARKASWGDAYF